MRSSIINLDRYFENYAFYGDFDVLVADKIKADFQHEEFPQQVKDRAGMGFCNSGHATFHINDQFYSIRQNDVIFIPPNSMLSVKEVSSDFQFKIILFSKKFTRRTVYSKSISLRDLFVFFVKRPFLPLTEEGARFFDTIMSLMGQAIRMTNQNFKDEILTNIISTLIMFIYDNISAAIDAKPVVLTRSDDLVTRFIALLEQHYKDEHQLSFYANQLCVTRKYLSTICRITTSHSARQLIILHIIAEAKRLLICTNLSASEIAYELGFPNLSSFGKYFKKEVGCSPSVFRRTV